jgi:bacterioferritin (cytochrome b1)
MIRFISFTGVLASLAASAISGPASAGIYTDDLTRCVVASSSATDRDMLMRWIFAAMAANPKIKDMSKMTVEQAEELSKSAAQLMQRLMLTDCRPQMLNAIKYESAGAIQAAFATLGQTSMADLMRDKASNAYMETLGTYFDQDKWAAMAAEAGAKPLIEKKPSDDDK